MNSGLVAPCNLTVDLLSWRPQHLASCVRCVWFRCIKLGLCCVSHLVGSITCASQFVIRLQHFKFGCKFFSADFGPFIGVGFTVKCYQLDFTRCILHNQNIFQGVKLFQLEIGCNKFVVYLLSFILSVFTVRLYQLCF